MSESIPIDQAAKLIYDRLEPQIRRSVANEITAAIASRRAEITSGRPGWVYLTEAIDITNRIGDRS